jgi:hypothetical protein
LDLQQQYRCKQIIKKNLHRFSSTQKDHTLSQLKHGQYTICTNNSHKLIRMKTKTICQCR